MPSTPLRSRSTSAASGRWRATSRRRRTSGFSRRRCQAVNIAERTLELLKEPLLKPLIDLPRMAELAQRMVKDSLDAFVQQDAERAREGCRPDEQGDRLDDQIF